MSKKTSMNLLNEDVLQKGLFSWVYINVCVNIQY